MASTEVLNYDVRYGTVGGPRYSTGISETDAGFEARAQRWDLALVRAEVGAKRMTQGEWEFLRDFFHRRRGRFEAFFLRDWSDDRLLNGNIGTGNGSQTTFQLVKHYGHGPTYTDGPTRTITAPFNTLVYKSGVLQTSGVTVNGATGVVTFSVAPAAGVVITASCFYYITVRFDVDHIEATFVGLDGVATDMAAERFYEVSSVPVVEVR